MGRKKKRIRLLARQATAPAQALVEAQPVPSSVTAPKETPVVEKVTKTSKTLKKSAPAPVKKAVKKEVPSKSAAKKTTKKS